MKGAAEKALHGMGALHVVRAAKGGVCRILMYHRFDSDPETMRALLTKQCEHLRRYYQPVSLSELAEALRTGSKLPARGLVITVDDGYQDLRLAFPIFRFFGLIVTVYVVSEFSGGSIWLWPDKVKLAFQGTERLAASVPLPSGQKLEFALGDRHARARAADQFEQAAMRLTNQERLQLLSDLPGHLALNPPAPTAPPGFEALSWDELRTMSAQGLEIGAHTRTHPIVSRLESRAAIADEIAGSKARIEEALGGRVVHFCYPNGRSEDYDERCVEAVREAGFETAVTTEAGFVARDADRFRLRRVGMDPDLPPLYFERRVAGLSR